MYPWGPVYRPGYYGQPFGPAYMRTFGALPPGQALTGPADEQTTGQAAETFTLSDMKAALGRITPTLLVVGIVTGAAFAVGSGLVSHFVFKGGTR